MATAEIVPIMDLMVRDFLTPDFLAWWAQFEERRPDWYPDLYWRFGRAMAALAFDAGLAEGK